MPSAGTQIRKPKAAVRGDQNAQMPKPTKAYWCNDLVRSRIRGPALHQSRHLEDWSAKGLNTAAVHAGSLSDEFTGAVGTPIYQNTTFLLGTDQYKSFEDGFARDRFVYTRYGNPSQWAVQEKIAALEHAESALVFSSGMAAIASSVLALAEKGSHIVTSRDLYGGTYRFFHQELPSLGIQTTFADMRSPEAIRAALRPETQILYFEALSNPLLKVANIPVLAEIARAHGAHLIIDATFVTPIGCRPLELGADVVVHSASKYMNGHSDLIAGAAAGNRKWIDRVWERLMSFGGCLDPHGCFMLERGLKTLPLRMKAHAEGALGLAQWLSAHPSISAVYYPMLPGHPDYALAQSLLRNAGGVIAFEVKGGDAAALRLCERLRLPKQATSLGGVESLISLPFNTSHAALTEAQRASLGIRPGCVRLSVGIEDCNDLIDDFQQALSSN